MKHVAVLIASFGYVGFFPIAPGTAGSLAALALFAFIRWIGVPSIELSAIVAVFAIGVWAAQGTERALGRKDPGIVVIDEVLGMLITLALLPLSLDRHRARLPAVPRARCDQAVSRGAARALTWRPGHHGR